MKFLVDQNLPPELANFIRRANHRAEHVFYVGLADVDDSTIIQFARQEDWVIVSRDADFVTHAGGGDILTWFQLVWVRLGNCTNEQLFAAWDSAWENLQTCLARGDPVVELV
jgi:predicted nuclease of predicted toxin-antitoxin system